MLWYTSCQPQHLTLGTWQWTHYTAVIRVRRMKMLAGRSRDISRITAESLTMLEYEHTRLSLVIRRNGGRLKDIYIFDTTCNRDHACHGVDVFAHGCLWRHRAAHWSKKATPTILGWVRILHVCRQSWRTRSSRIAINRECILP